MRVPKSCCLASTSVVAVIGVDVENGLVAEALVPDQAADACFAGLAAPLAHSAPEMRSRMRLPSRNAAPAAESSSRAPLRDPPAFSQRAGRSDDDGGIELPEQTYPQMLERTVGA